MKPRGALLAGALCLAPAGGPRADALPPPTPVSCPAGAVVRAVHAGTFCALDECSTSTPCANGECVSRRVCVEAVATGGLSGGTLLVHRGACDRGEPCGPGATCESVRLCVRSGFEGCGCAVPGAGRISGLWGALGALAVVMFARQGRPRWTARA
ncbi:MAG: hypothetical protein HY909_07445 [Deltaproteobacteria bacterium]|nr:hypothetical protein [Deltaproteobacteria bacterium]